MVAAGPSTAVVSPAESGTHALWGVPQGKQGALQLCLGHGRPLSLGKAEKCSHLPVLDGTCLHPFAAMGILGLR